MSRRGEADDATSYGVIQGGQGRREWYHIRLISGRAGGPGSGERTKRGRGRGGGVRGIG